MKQARMVLHRELKAHLQRWGVRLRLAESLRWAAWGSAAGLFLALILSLVARLVPLWRRPTLAAVALLLTLAGTGAGCAAAWLRPHPLHRRARTIEVHLDLAERLTTAVEIGLGHLQTSSAMARAQLQETLTAAQQIDTRSALPLHLPRRALLAAGLAVLALTLSLWLPNPQERALRQRAAVQQAVEEQIEILEALQEKLAQTEGLSEAERQALLQTLEETIAELEKSRANPDPEEALAALSSAEQTLAPLQDVTTEQREAGLQRAAAEWSDSELTAGLAAALTQGDTAAAAQELAAFAAEKGEALTREEELQLARELAQAAATMGETNHELAEQLAAAATAIEQGRIDEAREAIRQAAEQLAEAGQEMEAYAAVEESLAALQEGRERIAQAGGTTPLGADGSGDQITADGWAGGSSQSGSGQQTEPGHHEDAGSGMPYDEVYVPYRLDEEGNPVDLGRPDDEGTTIGEAPLPAPESGQATVPYRDVYTGYARRAQNALDSSYIPLGMKQYVRDYFASLEP